MTLSGYNHRRLNRSKSPGWKMTGIILHTMLLFRRGPRFPAFPGDTVEINVLEAQSKGLIRLINADRVSPQFQHPKITTVGVNFDP